MLQFLNSDHNFLPVFYEMRILPFVDVPCVCPRNLQREVSLVVSRRGNSHHNILLRCLSAASYVHTMPVMVARIQGMSSAGGGTKSGQVRGDAAANVCIVPQ